MPSNKLRFLEIEKRFDVERRYILFNDSRLYQCRLCRQDFRLVRSAEELRSLIDKHVCPPRAARWSMLGVVER